MDPAIKLNLKEVLQLAFREDLGFGDISSLSVLPGKVVKGIFTAKASGTLAGTMAIETGYQLLDETMFIELLKQDGDRVTEGEEIARVEGTDQILLSGERVILNLLQHLSGIATATAEAVNALDGSSIRICDTRKTLPGLRALQKFAVRCGGGFNHRLRLDDTVMIKDNHIKAAGGIRQAVKHAKSRAGLSVKIEVECETETQVKEAIEAGADIIMLDNRTPDEARDLLENIPDHIIVELSGGITIENVGTYRNCGADYISLGALTHSVKALDISFNLMK
jgi:nicotinate-nucleotide pyrophosphorylase (carboxylating)